MTTHFMRSYAELLVKTCHRRNIHAMGGMAAHIPIRTDPAASHAALDRVRADKVREANDGHDGTWVAHPGLVRVAREVFDLIMNGRNQIHRKEHSVVVVAEDLLRPPPGVRTEEGLRHNVRVGVRYLEAWLMGSGCVPLYHLMEDAATAEISRTQVWQWIHHGARLADGRRVTLPLFKEIVAEEMERVRSEAGARRFESGRFPEARELFETLTASETCADFLTPPAYDRLLRIHSSGEQGGGL